MTGITVETDRAGRRVALKHVDGMPRARAEAALLQSLGHPGTVEALGLDDHDGAGAVIVLTPVDGPRLTDVTLAPGQLAAVVAALATTVGDLHADGIVHGALRGDHVLLDAGTAPRLCGFGAAVTRPAGADIADPRSDVYDLAILVRDGVARWRTQHGEAGRDERRAADTVDRIAQRVVVAPPARRPSARTFAAELSRVDGARLPGPAPARNGRSPAVSRLRPAIAVACIGVSLTVSVLAIARLASGHPGDAAPARVVTTPPTTTPPTTAPPTTTPPTTTPPTTTPPTTAPPTTAPPTTAASTMPVVVAARCAPAPSVVVVDPDGDGCGERAQVDKRRIRTPSGLFEVGEDGDELALGDWDCDGLATPAVLRPATGRIFVFGRWPGSAEVAGAAVATVPGATAVHAVREAGSRCDRLVVDRATGASQVVDLGGSS